MEPSSCCHPIKTGIEDIKPIMLKSTSQLGRLTSPGAIPWLAWGAWHESRSKQSYGEKPVESYSGEAASRNAELHHQSTILPSVHVTKEPIVQPGPDRQDG